MGHCLELLLKIHFLIKLALNCPFNCRDPKWILDFNKINTSTNIENLIETHVHL